MLSLWEKFKAFYKASLENRLQIVNIFAFFVIPIVGMAVLYILVRTFWM